MKDAILRVNNVTKSVDNAGQKLTILDGVSLSIEPGQSLAIIGPSGAGKSTLLGLMAGLDTPSSGEIFLGEHELTALDEEGRAAVRAKMVGFVFQTFQLLPYLRFFLRNISSLFFKGTNIHNPKVQGT